MNGWKLVPVEPTDDMLMAFDENCDGLDPEIAQSQWQKILAAAPVPPAGVICDEVAPITEQAWRSLDSQPAGDVEVVCYAWPKDLEGDGYGHSFSVNSSEYPGMVGLVRFDEHDAKVTRLTAENARLQAELKEALHTSVKEDVFDVVCKERDALKSELAELADLKAYVTIPLRERCAQRLAMQSDLTKARELLNQWLNMFEGGLKSGDLDSLWNETADYVDPTINPSAPAAKADKDPRCCCPPEGFSGLWAAGPCPTHMGFGAFARKVKP